MVLVPWLEQSLNPALSDFKQCAFFVVECVPQFSLKQSFSPRPRKAVIDQAWRAPDLPPGWGEQVGLRHGPGGSPSTGRCTFWMRPHQLTGAWLRDCPDRFAGFLFTGSCFPGHHGGFLPLLLSFWLHFFSNSFSSLLSPVPAPKALGHRLHFHSRAQGSGPLASPGLPAPPARLWPRRFLFFFNGYKIIDNYRKRNANNNKSHVLGPYQT